MKVRHTRRVRRITLFLVLILAVVSLAACLDYDTGRRTGEELRELTDATSEFLNGVRDGYGGEVCPGILAPGLVIGLGIYAAFAERARREG